MKRYIFCSNYDELFALGEDYMTQVEYIDYGLGWDKLKPGQQGDQIMYEIVDFEVMSDIEQIEFEKRWEKRLKREEAMIARERARQKMRNRLKRMIMGKYYRQYYWLPGMVHGRLILILSSIMGSRASELDNQSFRLGIYLCSLAIGYCLRESLRFSELA